MINSNGSDIPDVDDPNIVEKAIAWAMVRAAYAPLGDADEQQIADYLKRITSSFTKVYRAVHSDQPIQDN